MIVNSFVKAAAAYRTYVERVEGLRRLRQLSPRELADIGVEPFELEASVLHCMRKRK